MDIEQIKEYFEKYIEKFPVYQNNKFFEGLTNYLVDYYYNNTYNNIPYELKTLYENQELEPAVYDKFLIVIGVPQDVINKLSYRDKIIFLKSLNDFRKYKGTIEFINKIGLSFSDTFNVYELFIDYSDNDQAWFFKPVLVYKDKKLEAVQQRLTYQEVYDAIPSFLVPVEQLENLRIDNRITLPIKSNILLLDQQIVDNVSLLNNLIIATFLKDYKDTYVNIYFAEDQYSLNFGTIFYTWYYLASRYYGTDWKKLNPLLYVLQFEDYNNPYSVFDLKDVIAEYDELENSADVSKFYNEKFGFFQQYVQSSDRDLNDMQFYLENMDNIFYDYLENRLTNAVDEKKEIDTITNDILNSLLYYRSSYVTTAGVTNDPFLEYFDYFLSALPQLTINPEDTISYTLIYNFKPYHTELLSTISNVINCEDKFNSAITSDEHWFHFEMIKYELLSMLDERYFDLKLFKQSDLKLLSLFRVDMSFNLIDDLEEQIGDTLSNMLFLEYVTHSIKTQEFSAITLSSVKQKIEMIKNSVSSLNLISIVEILNSIKCEDLYELDDLFIIKYLLKIGSSIAISESVMKQFECKKEDVLNQISIVYNSITKNQTEVIDVEEVPLRNMRIPTLGDVYTISEVYTIS